MNERDESKQELKIDQSRDTTTLEEISSMLTQIEVAESKAKVIVD